jgi:hypothetical protein
MHELRLLSVSLLVGALILSAAALGSRGGRAEAAPEDDIEAVFEAVIATWNAQDAEAFAALFSDEGLADQFDYTREEAIPALQTEMEGMGPIASGTITDIFVTSGQATAVINLQFEAGFSLFEKWQLTYDFTAGGWLVGESEPISRPIPDNVPVVPLELQEYAFHYDAAAIQAADGNFVFDVTNAGQEEHEVVLFEITTGGPLADVVQAIAESGEEEQPEGVGGFEFLGFFEPGQDRVLIPSAPLANGRYGLICFVPAPDGTPHALLGMVSEFSVGQAAGGGITPPSTGDAGLLGTPAGAWSWVLLATAVAFVVIGAGNLVARR